MQQQFQMARTISFSRWQLAALLLHHCWNKNLAAMPTQTKQHRTMNAYQAQLHVLLGELAAGKKKSHPFCLFTHSHYHITRTHTRK